MNYRLESWLASATLGLAIVERQRIVEEISAHVTDATAHQIVQGLSATDAEAQALADLGGPQVARAAFLRTCYTVSDERRLEKLLGRSWWTLVYAWVGIGLPITLIILLWLNVPVSFQANMGVSDSGFVIVILTSLATTPLYYFEPRIKNWLYKRFSSNGVFAAQAFMLLIVGQPLYSALKEVFKIVHPDHLGTFSGSFGTWIVVLILTYRWMAHQAPLTLKTIRRTRA